MIATISILAAMLLGMVGLLAFAPMAEFRRRGLKSVLTTAAIIGALGMGICFAAFIALMMSGNPGLSKLSMHALMAAIAMPLVVGMAAIAFGVMAMTWQNVFERSNDQFAATIYVLIGLTIVVASASGSLKADWPGYLIAALAVPLMPAMVNRRLRRSRPAGFGAEAAEAFLVDRAEQTATRWAEPVIAPRAPKAPRRPAAATKVAAKPQSTSNGKPAPQKQSPATPARAAADAPVKRAAKPTTNPARKAPAISRVTTALPSKNDVVQAIEKLRRRAAAAIAPATAASPAASAQPAAQQTQPVRPAISPSRPPARSTSIAAAPQPAAPPSTAAQAARRIAAPAPSSAAKPATGDQQRRARPAAPDLAKPSLLPPGVAPVTAPPRKQAAAVTQTNDRRKPTAYPLTAPFEPDSDRWATFIDGTLTTETGIVRKVAARSTQALEDISGAA